MEPIGHTLTGHAETRRQQRGIPYAIIDLLLKFGDSEWDKHDAEIIYFSKRSLSKIGATRATPGANVERYKRAYLILSHGRVVTCGHRTNHLFRH